MEAVRVSHVLRDYLQWIMESAPFDILWDMPASYALEGTGSGVRIAIRLGNVTFSDIMVNPKEGELLLSAELLAQRASRFVRRLAHFRSLRASMDETGEVGHGCLTHERTPLRAP
jgi:hypothetical protein